MIRKHERSATTGHTHNGNPGEGSKKGAVSHVTGRGIMANLAGTLLTGTAAVSLAALGFSAHDGFVNRIDYALDSQYAMKLDKQQFNPQSIDLLSPQSLQDARFVAFVNTSDMIDTDVVRRNVNDNVPNTGLPIKREVALSFRQTHETRKWHINAYKGAYDKVNINLTSEKDAEKSFSQARTTKVTVKRLTPSVTPDKHSSGCDGQRGPV